ncbi:MAG: hypothetical protein WAM94_12895, partial [Chromatiaceae bacterium]
STVDRAWFTGLIIQKSSRARRLSPAVPLAAPAMFFVIPAQAAAGRERVLSLFAEWIEEKSEDTQ